MIDTLIAIAREAGDRLDANEGFSTSTKSDEWDFVTSADIDLDKYLRARLSEEFPDIPILSEESDHAPDISGRVFMVDPIDGTKDFVFGGSDYCIMIGLLEDGVPVKGVIYIPERDVMLHGERGNGSFCTSSSGTQRLSVSDRELGRTVRAGRIKRGESRPQDALDESLPARSVIHYGSSGMKYFSVASGEADIIVGSNMRTSKWDTCASTVILEEAGGRVTGLDGSPLDYSQSSNAWNHYFLASNGVAHDEALSLLKDYLEAHPELRR